MTEPTVGNSTASRKSSRLCPSSQADAHRLSKAGAPQLSNAEIRAALATTKIGPGSPIWRSARYHAWRAGAVADDLMQEAVLRALTTRHCPAHIGVEQFLKGVMRSIASTIVRRRELEDAEAKAICAIVIEGLRNEAPSPAEELERERRSLACQNALNQIGQGRPNAIAVIDGIGHGHQGEALASFAGIDAAELSNVRRLIKRRAVSIQSDFLLEDAA